MKINIYVVDDLIDNVNRFEEITKNLLWLQKLAKSGSAAIIESVKLAQTIGGDTTKFNRIIQDTGLNESELTKLKDLFVKNHQINWDRLLEDVSNMKLNVISFHMNSDIAYKEAINIVKSCKGICFWVVDVVWARKFEILNYLEYPIKDLWNNYGYEQNYLGAYNIAYQVIIRNKIANDTTSEFYVIPASTASKLDPIFNIPNCQLRKSQEKYFIRGSDSIFNEGTPSIIVRILKVFWQNYLVVPINKIRFLSSSNNDKSWFKEDYENSSSPEEILVPHNFPHNKNYFSYVSQYLFENLKITDSRYNYFVHEGLKSICLSGNRMGVHTVYAIAILADAQSDQSSLYLDNIDNTLPTYIPLVKNSNLISDKGNLDFVESLYSFFVEFLQNGQIQVSYGEFSLKFVSSQPVIGKADSLFTRICDHLIFYSQHGQWQDAHTTSRPLAQCIEFGGWGLIGEQEVIRHQTGAFLITMQDKEVRFSWDED